MSPEVLEKWFKREHPSGEVDWRKEYARLHFVVQQMMPSQGTERAENLPKLLGHAVTGVVYGALEVGDWLLEKFPEES